VTSFTRSKSCDAASVDG